jgi:membrane protein YqaA with SNARE-associated domain
MSPATKTPGGPPDSGALAALVEQASARVRSRLRTAVFVAENLLVLALLAWWIAFGRDGHVNGPLVLFLYCFPSEFMIAPVPHEPVLIYFGKVYAPWLVALVSVAGTLLVEALNYHAFAFVADARPLQRVVRSRLIGRLVALFGRSPFVALVVGGLAPVPFYPFRFVVVLARYPLARYLAAVFVSRLPRFYLMALLGATLRFPDAVFLAIFGVFLGIGLGPLIPWSRLRGLRKGGKAEPAAKGDALQRSAADTADDAQPKPTWQTEAP